jgi:hypothetical protein
MIKHHADKKLTKLVHLSLSAESLSHLAVFFSRNKSIVAYRPNVIGLRAAILQECQGEHMEAWKWSNS